MKAYIEKEDREVKVDFVGTVHKLLEKLKINPETVIVTRENELISDDDKVSSDDRVEILSVVSGG